MPTHTQNPFSKMSTTFLLAVFEAVCDYKPVHLPLCPSHPRHVLNTVCKTWYKVVRSSGSLWNNIHFTAPNTGEVHQPHPILPQLEFCVRLSGSSALVITFDIVFNGWAFSIVGSVIIPHAHRIQQLSCIVYGNEEIKMFFTMGEGRFRILESLDVCFMNTLVRPISSFPLADCLDFTTFRASPCLRHATFHLLNGLHPLDLHLPWGQISTLNLGTVAMPPHIFVKILHASAWRLEDGNFYVRFTKPLPQYLNLSMHPVTMHALRTLRLRLHFPSQDHRLFTLLRLPVLQRLYIKMYDLFQDWDIGLYTELLGASKETLRELHLGDYPPDGSEVDGFVVRRRHHKTSPQVLATFFRVISNVESLRLPLGLEIDAATAAEMASYILLPKLFSLELSSVHGWPILSMARRRHALFIGALLAAVQAEFEPGLSQRPVIEFRPPRCIRMLIPGNWSMEQKRALVQEGQALGVLGIQCNIQSTHTLPIPVVDPRDIMRVRLLAWVTGVPREGLF